jgi:hypothetical protein
VSTFVFTIDTDGSRYLESLLTDRSELFDLVSHCMNPADALLDVLAKEDVAAFAGAVYYHLDRATEKRDRLLRFVLDRKSNPVHYTHARLTLGQSIRSQLEIAWIVNRRLVRATLDMWSEQVLTSLLSGVGLGVIYWNAETLSKLTAVYIFLVSQFCMIAASRAGALYTHRQLIACEFKDGVVSMYPFIFAAIGFVTAQTCFSTAIMTATLMMIDHQTWDTRVAGVFFSAMLATETIFNLAIVVLVQTPGLSFSNVYNYQFYFFLLSSLFGGIMATKDQLENTIGEWILDVSPIFHAMAMVSRVALPFESSYINADGVDFDAAKDNVVRALTLENFGCVTIPNIVNRCVSCVLRFIRMLPSH